MWIATHHPHGGVANLFTVTVLAGNFGGATTVGIRIMRLDGKVVLELENSLTGGFTGTFTMAGVDIAPTDTDYYRVELFNSWDSGGDWHAPWISLTVNGAKR
jgi:hypothetical protein